MPIDDHFACDIESGGNQFSVRPLAHLFGGVRVTGDVNLDVFKIVAGQPRTCPSTIGTPLVAVHDDIGFFRRGWFLNLGRGGFHLWLDAIDLSKKDFVAGLILDIVDVDVLNAAFFIDDEDGAFRIAFVTQDAIFFGYFTLGPEIAQQGVRDSPQAVGPRFQTGNMIYADAQNLDISIRKLGIFCLVRRNLVRSNWCPG